MQNIEEFVKVNTGESTPKTSRNPVSFRCSDEIVIKMDLLAQHLGFGTRSKLLSELVPVALNEAIDRLPDHIGIALSNDYDQQLDVLYHQLKTRDL